MRKKPGREKNILHIFRDDTKLDTSKYGHTLTNYLKKHRITQQHLADTLGVTREVVAHWCLRSYNPSLFTAIKIHILTQGRVSYINMLTKKEWKKLEREFSGVTSKLSEKIRAEIDAQRIKDGT